ncbi:hypothetical protein BDV11DRAFT_178911 [Aspergillus similis]
MASHPDPGDETSSTKQRITAEREKIDGQIQSVLSTSDGLPPSEDYYTRSTGQNWASALESNSPGNTNQASPSNDEAQSLQQKIRSITETGYPSSPDRWRPMTEKEPQRKVDKVKLAKTRDMSPPGFMEIMIFSRGHPVVWTNAALVLFMLVFSFFFGGGPLPTSVLFWRLLVLGAVDYAVCRWYLRRRRFTYHPDTEKADRSSRAASERDQSSCSAKPGRKTNPENGIRAQDDRDPKHGFQDVKLSVRSGPWTVLRRNPTHPVVWMNAILLVITVLLFRALWHRSLFAQLLFLAGLGFWGMIDYDITLKWLRERPYKQGALKNWLGYSVIW